MWRQRDILIIQAKVALLHLKAPWKSLCCLHLDFPLNNNSTEWGSTVWYRELTGKCFSPFINLVFTWCFCFLVAIYSNSKSLKSDWSLWPANICQCLFVTHIQTKMNLILINGWMVWIQSRMWYTVYELMLALKI